MQDKKNKKPYLPVGIRKTTYALSDVLTASGEGFDDSGAMDNTATDFTDGWDLE